MERAAILPPFFLCLARFGFSGCRTLSIRKVRDAGRGDLRASGEVRARSMARTLCRQRMRHPERRILRYGVEADSIARFRFSRSEIRCLALNAPRSRSADGARSHRKYFYATQTSTASIRLVLAACWIMCFALKAPGGARTGVLRWTRHGRCTGCLALNAPGSRCSVGARNGVMALFVA